MMRVSFGSVCSGIEAASMAWAGLGWEPAWFSEIDPFPCEVLDARWPDVENLGDMLTIKGRILRGEAEAPDILAGGTPCQAFSVAGARGSLSDERGNLTLEFCEVANAIDDVRDSGGGQPSVIIWENVPGVLSTADNAFGCFLAGIAGDDKPLEPGPRPEFGRSSAHWTWKKDAGEHRAKWPDAGIASGPRRTVAWRVLDAQYFGLAQRRRRVFVVASARKGFDPGAVLFEFEGVRRDSAPGREAGEGVAAGTLRSSDGGGDGDHGIAGHILPVIGCEVDVSGIQRTVGTLCADTHPGAYSGQDAYTGRLVPHVVAVHGAQDPCVLIEQAHALGLNWGQENAIIFDTTQVTSRANGSNPKPGGLCHALSRGADAPAMCIREPASKLMRVRRLTPVECERLQGFPDNHTLIEFRGRPAADGNRYRAIGNSWAVPCARWIGGRVDIQISRRVGVVESQED